MWFIAVLFWLFMLYPVYQISFRKKWATAITWIIFLLLNITHVRGSSDFLCIDRVPTFLIYFYTGILISRFKFDDLLSEPIVILACGIFFILSQIFWTGFGTAMFGSIFFWGIAVKTDSIITGNLFSSFRDYTFQIFLIGIFAQMLVKVFYSKFHFPFAFTTLYVCCIFAGLYVPVIISKFIAKSNKRVLKMSCGLA